jgi:hypothetical protein
MAMHCGVGVRRQHIAGIESAKMESPMVNWIMMVSIACIDDAFGLSVSFTGRLDLRISFSGPYHR